jgi:hypothetical protein
MCWAGARHLRELGLPAAMIALVVVRFVMGALTVAASLQLGVLFACGYVLDRNPLPVTLALASRSTAYAFVPFGRGSWRSCAHLRAPTDRPPPRPLVYYALTASAGRSTALDVQPTSELCRPDAPERILGAGIWHPFPGSDAGALPISACRHWR